MNENIIQKLDCKNPKTVQHGFDLVCQDLTEWQVSFGSTSTPGRCPKCEEDRLYPSKLSHINMLDERWWVHVLIQYI